MHYLFIFVIQEDDYFYSNKHIIYNYIIKKNYNINNKKELLDKNKIIKRNMYLIKFINIKKFFILIYLSLFIFSIKLFSGLIIYNNNSSYNNSNIQYKALAAYCIIDNRFDNHNYNYDNDLINQTYNDKSTIPLKKKIYKTLSQNISINIKGLTYATKVIKIKKTTSVAHNPRGQITGVSQNPETAPSRNVGTSIGNSLLRNSSTMNSNLNRQNTEQQCYRSFLTFTTQINFVDKLKWSLYNNFDFILPNLLQKKTNLLNISKQLQNKIIFEWLFYDVTNKQRNYENKFFIKIKSFYENEQVDCQKIKNNLDFGLFLKSNKLNKSYITLAFNPINKKFSVAYSFCLNDSIDTTKKNSKKKINNTKTHTIINTKNKQTMAFASMSTGETLHSSNVADDSVPITEQTIDIGKEDFVEVQMEPKISNNILKDYEELNSSTDVKELKKKKQIKSVKGLGVGLSEKNKNSQLKKINNESKNLLFNILNVVSISGVIVFSLINQTILPIISERIVTLLRINNTFLKGWFLGSIIYGVGTVISFIFNMFGNISTTTQNAENISGAVSESVDLVNNNIVEPLSDTFVEVYNQIIQIVKILYNAIKEDDLIKNLNNLITLIKILIFIIILKTVFPLLPTLQSVPIIRGIFAIIVKLLEDLEDKLNLNPNNWKNPPNDDNENNSTNNLNPYSPLNDLNKNGESSMVEKTVKIGKPKLKKPRSRNPFILNLKKIFNIK